MKRTPEESQKTVEQIKAALKADPELRVKDALKKFKMATATWHKYKGKRKAYKKSEPTITAIEPVKLSGGKTLLIISEDSELISKLIERYA